MPNEVKAQNTIDLTSLKELSDAVDNTDQYFWHTTTDTGAGAGAHITQIPQVDFLNDPANGGGNTLIDSNSFKIRDGLTELAKFSSSSIILGDENATNTAYAKFTNRRLDMMYNGQGFAGMGIINNSPNIYCMDPVAGDQTYVFADSIQITEANGLSASLSASMGLGFFDGDSTTIGVYPTFDTNYTELALGGVIAYTSKTNSKNYIGTSKVWVGDASGGINHGVYSEDIFGWLVRSNGSDIYAGSVNVTDGLSCRNSINASGTIRIEEKSINVGSISANSYKSANVSYSAPTNYKAICIVGWYPSGTNTSFIVPIRLVYDQTAGQISYGLRNIHSSAVTTTLNVRILCVYDA